MAKRSIWLSITGNALLVLVGLLVGLALFTPWRSVWEMALQRLNRELSQANISYQAIERATFDGLRLRGVLVEAPKTQLRADSLDLRLGLLTPLRVEVQSGPEVLRLSLSWSKTLLLDGGVEIGSLLAKDDSAGRVQANGEIGWDDWGQPPQSGHLALDSEELVWEGLTISDLLVKTDLKGTELLIDTLSLEKPVKMSMEGRVDLNWKRLGQSMTDVKGQVILGDKPTNFTRKNTLDKVLSQAGM